jgi:RNA polymerase sigma-70 factor (ECF subfamily)
MKDGAALPREPIEDAVNDRLSPELPAHDEVDEPSSDASTLSPSDAEIIARVLAGDLDSFELIMRRYNQRLFRLARSVVRDDDEAEDIVQESYVRAYQRMAQLENRSLLSAWIARITFHESLARRRRSRRMVATDFTDSGEASIAPPTVRSDPGEAVHAQELGLVLTAAVDALPDDLRTVFTLRLIEGLNTQETAESLELTEANVKTRLHRARALLQDRIDGQIGTEVRRLYQFGGERCNRIVAIGGVRHYQALAGINSDDFVGLYQGDTA